MSKRKGNTDAQKPADPQQEAVSQDLPKEVTHPETETAVAVSGREPASAAGEEHQAEPDAPADEGAAVVDGAQGATAEQSDPVDADLAAETAEESDPTADAGGQDVGEEADHDPAFVVDQETLNDGQHIEGDLADGAEPEAAAEGQGDAAADPDGNLPGNAAPGHGDGVADGAAGTAGVQSAVDGGDQAAAGDTDASAADAYAASGDGIVPAEGAPAVDGEADGDVPGAEGDLSSVYASDAAIAAAEEAAQAVAGYLDLHHLTDTELERVNIFTAAVNSIATNAMAEIARQIGTHDDMASVAATQLNILGIIDNPILTDAEQLVVQTFVNVLVGIDRFDKRIEDRRAAAEADANRAKPKPVPIEETNLEQTDGPMDLERGR